MKKNNILLSSLHVLALCIVVVAVSAFFIYHYRLIGWVLAALGIACVLSLKLFGISVRSVRPDVLFGVIDNGILAGMAVWGGEVAGVAGAVFGGVVGNAVTDGIAGLFEGYLAEHSNESGRTLLGSAVGKMAGCLIGAGAVLVIAGIGAL